MYKNVIAKPLTFVINQTLRTGCYPDTLKLARVGPRKVINKEFKIIDQYPFCLLFHKFLIFFIHAQSVSYFDNNILFSDTQYGYRSGCSAEFPSMEFTDSIYNHLGFIESVRYTRSQYYITYIRLLWYQGRCKTII